MNDALETSTKDTAVTVGVKPSVTVGIPNLTAQGIDHGAAEDATGAEGHRTRGFVREYLGTAADHIDQGATVGGHVITFKIPANGKPFPADEVIGWEDHKSPLFGRQVKRSVELRANGKVRHLNIPDAVLVKEVDIELIPGSNSRADLPDAP